MSFISPQRFLRGMSNHRRGDSLGSFPNPMLDVFRWKLFYDDFNFGPAAHDQADVVSLPSFGGGWHYLVSGGITDIGIAKGEPSCYQVHPGAGDDDAVTVWPGSGTNGTPPTTTSMTNSTTPLDPDKDLIVVTRFKTQSADDQDFSIGLGTPNEIAAITDTTPNGLVVQGTDGSNDIIVRIGATDTKTVTLSTSRAAATFYDVVAYYQGKDRTLQCWLDGVHIDTIDADGAITLGSRKGVLMGTQNGSATLAWLRVDYLMIAIER